MLDVMYVMIHMPRMLTQILHIDERKVCQTLPWFLVLLRSKYHIFNKLFENAPSSTVDGSPQNSASNCTVFE